MVCVCVCVCVCVYWGGGGGEGVFYQSCRKGKNPKSQQHDYEVSFLKSVKCLDTAGHSFRDSGLSQTDFNCQCSGNESKTVAKF